MPKSIKELFEVYRPKAKDEADFVDKHVTIKHKDRNGNDDDVFKGSTKYIKRKEERKGYDVGEDEKVYEDLRDQVLKSLMDAAEELGEELDEEALDAIAEEVLDELSKDTLGSYVKKASNQAFSKGYSGGSMMVRGDMNRDSEEEKAGEKNVHKAIKRVSGISKAVNKMTKEEILNNFIDTYIPEDAEVPTPEERLVECLVDQDVSEQNIHILLSMFESLNEPNQMRMLESVSDIEGINSLLDFAIVNRGTE
jgi:hypothetical protein